MAGGDAAVRVVVETDPAAFVDRAGAFLHRHPVEHSVLLTRSAQAADGAVPAADEPNLWLWAEDLHGGHDGHQHACGEEFAGLQG